MLHVSYNQFFVKTILLTGAVLFHSCSFFYAMDREDTALMFIDTLKKEAHILTNAIHHTNTQYTLKAKMNACIEQFRFLKKEEYKNKEWQKAYYTVLTTDLLIPFVYAIRYELFPREGDLLYLASFITHHQDRLHYYIHLVHTLNKESLLPYLLLKNKYRAAYQIIQSTVSIPFGYAPIDLSVQKEKETNEEEEDDDEIDEKKIQEEAKCIVKKLVVQSMQVHAQSSLTSPKKKADTREQICSLFIFLYQIMKPFFTSFKRYVRTVLKI